MISQAYIFAKDNKCVWTFASYDSEQAVFSDRNVFPKCIINKMEKITIWQTELKKYLDLNALSKSVENVASLMLQLD